MDQRTEWLSPVPDYDDFDRLIGCEFIDGKTKFGQWAIMAPQSHKTHGVGIGVGLGQRYELYEDGRWLKVEG